MTRRGFDRIEVAVIAGFVLGLAAAVLLFLGLGLIGGR